VINFKNNFFVVSYIVLDVIGSLLYVGLLLLLFLNIKKNFKMNEKISALLKYRRDCILQWFPYICQWSW